MAEGRREFGGLVAAWHLAGVFGLFPGGNRIDPADINPFKIPVPQSDAMRELLAWRRRRAMKSFGEDVARVVRRRG